jgi:hypothetical protein
MEEEAAMPWDMDREERNGATAEAFVGREERDGEGIYRQGLALEGVGHVSDVRS